MINISTIYILPFASAETRITVIQHVVPAQHGPYSCCKGKFVLKEDDCLIVEVVIVYKQFA